jgi:hypothetical protein
MHSLPAMFTLPIRVWPNRIRSLSMLVVLIIIFGISPLVTSHFYTGCAYGRQFQGTFLERWRAPEPEYAEQLWVHLPRDRAVRDVLKRRFMCYETTLIPWWKANTYNYTVATNRQ